MTKRYHCEFKNCFCTKYKHNKNLCLNCNHANIWHSRKKKVPFNYKNCFVSPRMPARTPIYETVCVAIEIPVAKVLYCCAVDELPV